MATSSLPVPPSETLRISTSFPSPGRVRVAVAGEIDLSTADILRAALVCVLPVQRPHHLEADLGGVTFMDCTGLAVMVVAGKAAARAGCRLEITNAQPPVRRILDLTGLLGILTSDDDPPPSAGAAPASLIGRAAGSAARPDGLLIAV